MNDDPVKVFITYSWDDKNHKAWVKQLADELLSNGIDATIDQYDVGLGERLPHFMEKSIAEATFVLVVCTPNYKMKSDDRNGGVGYESHLISGELLQNRNEKKYIPILRRGTIENAIPSFLIGKFAYDLSENLNKNEYEDNLYELIAKLKGKRKKPLLAISKKENTAFESLAGATIHATIGEYDKETNTFTVRLYDYDYFTAEKIEQLSAGDIVLIGGTSYTVKEMTIEPFSGARMAIMDDETEVVFTQSGNDKVFAMSTLDDRMFMHSYSMLFLKVAEEIIYEDASDPDNMGEIAITKDLDEILRIKAYKERYGIGFDFYATTITLNDKLEISKIHQDYDVAQ